MFHKSQLFFCFLLAFNTHGLEAQETCPSNSNKPYEWPSQRNWFIAPNLYSGIIVNMKTMGVTSVGGPGNAVTSYEGVSAASNDKGELLFYTNGRSLWTKTGSSVTKTYSGLLTGNEGGMSNGSATQGVITVRHPLDRGRYWVVTTDDALGSTKGMNAFSFDTLGNLLSGPTRLGSFRTSEGISAALHSNGIDVWVTCLASGTGKFHTFLLKCNGFEMESVVSSIGPNVTSGKERGGIAFSWDGEFLAQAHPNWWPDGDKIVSIYKFNKTTGQLYDAKNVSGAWGSPYDITWSPNNKRVYVSMQNNSIHYLDISSWDETSIKNSWTSTGVSSKFTAIEVGYDGSLYLSHGQAGGGYLKKMNGDLNTATSFTTSNIAGTSGMSHLGLPTIYIPPSDEPDIQEVGPYCSSDSIVDLNTLWICSSNNAENPSENPLAYRGSGIIDRAKGIFDPSLAGEGTHQVIFEYCSVNDTTWITVNNCTSCSVNIEDVQPEVCIGESLILDVYVEKATGAGEWSLDSFPTGVSPKIIDDQINVFDVSNLDVASGVYKLKYTVTDGLLSCYDSIYITVNPVPNPELGSDQSICKGIDFATFDAGLFDSYLWQPNSETSQTISTDVGGDYIVTVTDINKCTANDTVTLTSHPVPTPDLGSDQSICGGNRFITFDAGLYDSYLWQPNLETSRTITTDKSGDYVVTVTDINKCTANDTVTLTSHPVPTPDLGSDQSICGGNRFITFDAGLYDSYLWQPNLETSRTITTDKGGDYIVTVTDINNCSASDTVTLASYPVPNPDLGSDQSNCEGSGFITLDAGLYESYLWQPNSEISQTISVDVSGEYIVTVTDVNNCTASDTVIFISYPVPTPNLGPDQTICRGSEFAIFDPGLYDSYLWQPNSETSQKITTDQSNEYVVTVTDSNNCIASDTVNLIAHPVPLLNLGLDISVCPEIDTTIYIGSNWQKISWNDSSYGDSLKLFIEGTYYVDVIDLNGCSASDTLSFIFLEKDQVNLGNDITICQDGEAKFNIEGYSNYLWHDGSSANKYMSSSEETIWVEVKDSNGCISKDSAQIFMTENLPVDLGPDIDTCNENSVNLSSGYTDSINSFIWSTGETSQDILINTSGTYFVSVTDINGCVGFDTIFISLHQIPNFNLGPNKTICDGDSVLLDVGNGWSDIIWSGGYSGQKNYVKTAGDYSVQVIDENGCEANGKMSLIVNSIPIMNLGNDVEVCHEDEFIFSTTPNNFDSYLWHDGSTSEKFKTTNPQVISVLVTDQNGCFAADSVLFTNLPPVEVNLPENQTICEGQIYEILVPDFDENSHTFLWNDASTNSSLQVQKAGDYSVYVTNGHGCVGFDTITIDVYSKPIPSVGNVGICENETAILGTGVYESYIWNTGQKSQEIEVSSEGVYTVTVEDSNGCSGSGSGTLTVYNKPLVSEPSDKVFCEGGGLFLSPSLPKGNYNWKPGGETTSSIYVNTVGDYEVVITNDFGCADSVIINVSQTLNPTIDLGPDIRICDGETTFIGFSAQNSTITWNTGEVSDYIEISKSGSYEAKILDLNNCSGKDEVEVIVSSSPNPVLPNDTSVCFQEINGLPLKVNVESRDKVLWSTGDTSISINIHDEGSYEVLVTNINGCIGKDTVEVITKCPSSLWIPNAFTPNNDGINDFFGPKAINIFDYDFYIFNRFGELIFYSNNINDQWDGTFEGDNCQIGVYVWKLNYRSLETNDRYKTYEEAGSFNLLR